MKLAFILNNTKIFDNTQNSSLLNEVVNIFPVRFTPDISAIRWNRFTLIRQRMFNQFIEKLRLRRLILK